jgi:hypothetical protein
MFRKRGMEEDYKVMAGRHEDRKVMAGRYERGR